MNKETKLITMVVIGAAGVAVVYWYLQKSGLWAQWFGGAASNSFTDPNQLLAYCQTNPGGQATYLDAAGKSYTYPCYRWIAENSGPVMNLPDSSPVDPALLKALQQAAIANPALGSDRGNVDQFNLLLQGIDPSAPIADLGVPSTEVMDSQQYLMLRIQAGLSGLAPREEVFESPYVM